MAVSSSHSDEAKDAEATQLTLHGIALIDGGSQTEMTEALACFERAIRLREALPLEKNPVWRWGLSAGWLNLAAVVLRLHGPLGRERALACYQSAQEQLQHLPPEASPAYRWRHAVAWVNRGQAEGMSHGPTALNAALECYDQALRLMEGYENSTETCFRQVQAAAYLNRGTALESLFSSSTDEVLACARCALQHSRYLEANSSSPTETSLKSRHFLCRVLAAKLEGPEPEVQKAEDWIHEATDAVEEVMALPAISAEWAGLKEEIFHFGCRIYRAFQPHFLAAFLEDGLREGPPSEAIRYAAREALAQAVLQYRYQPLAGLSPERMERLLRSLQALAETAHKHATVFQSPD